MVVIKMRGGLWNKIQREKLETGDHIYSLRGANKKAHHGIYVNDKKVIHFNGEAWADHSICPLDCFHPLVLSSCIDCFLSGGDLYRFEYGVNPAYFLAKFGRGCTLASTDKAKDVKHRASFLLNNGSGAYYRYINNGEDFAIFCKTGLLVVDLINFSRTWQIAYVLGVTAAVFFSLQKLMLDSFTGLPAKFLGLYCICRFATDIGARPNVIKINKVHKLRKVDKILACGGSGFQLIESYINIFVQALMLPLAFCLLSTVWSEPHQGWSRLLLVVWTQAFIILFYWAVLQRRLHSNKIQKEQLRRGDHIYTWRKGFTYAHHGIYVGDGNGREVIQLVRRGDPIIPSSSSPSHSHPSDNSLCTDDDGIQPTLPRHCRVEYCSIDSFVKCGELYLYKYGVSFAFLMAKTRGGTCTSIPSDPPKEVVYRAHFLQKNNSFGAYNLFNNNCENFAVYCKTTLPSGFDIGMGQTSSLFAVVSACAAFFCVMMPPKEHFDMTRNGQIIASLLGILAFVYNNFIDAAVTVYIIDCTMRATFDGLFDTSFFKVPVQRMTPCSRLTDWFQSNFCHFILS